MKRRAPVREDGTGAPERLRRFRAAEWPDAECHPECAYWEAVMAWMHEHPDDSLELDERGPDEPFHPELL